MATTLTLAGNNMNDGSTYKLIGTVEIEPLRVTSDFADNYSDASEEQWNVHTKGHSMITFNEYVKASSLTNLLTALNNLDNWVKAGGAFVYSRDGTSILSCTAGKSTPPTRAWDIKNFMTNFMIVTVELIRMT